MRLLVAQVRPSRISMSDDIDARNTLNETSIGNLNVMGYLFMEQLMAERTAAKRKTGALRPRRTTY